MLRGEDDVAADEGGEDMRDNSKTGQPALGQQPDGEPSDER